MMSINQDDFKVMSDEFAEKHTSLNSFVQKCYHMGYERALRDKESGTVNKIEYKVFYADFGDPMVPFTFESKEMAERFKDDLIKRSFTNVRVRKVFK